MQLFPIPDQHPEARDDFYTVTITVRTPTNPVPHYVRSQVDAMFVRKCIESKDHNALGEMLSYSLVKIIKESGG